MQTCVALTNTYLYNSDFNDWYYDEFMKVSELPDAEMMKFFYENYNSKFQQYYDELQATIKTWIDDKNSLICNS